jgi:hypothetical protein
MESDYEKKLALEIDRELKGLPELRAPASLAARVMATIEHPIELPWYRCAWQNWPTPIQVAAMGILFAFLGALSYGAWELTYSAGFALALQKVGHWFSGISAIWNAANAICGAFVLAIKQQGSGFLIAAVAAVALAWAACFGLGTVYVRIAFARR